MTTPDLRKQLSALHKPSVTTPALVEVPPLRFLMLDGRGDIGGDSFQAAVQTLYGLAYPVKFAAKKQLGISYPVMPLEGLYRDPAGEQHIHPEMRERLHYTLMIVMPDDVSAEFVDEVRDRVAAKKDLPRLADVRVQTFSEGPSIQIMHLGPYSEEPPTVARLFAFAEQRGLDVTGVHHEIYLSDPTKSAPDKLKTVLRYGVTRRRTKAPAPILPKRQATSCRRKDACGARDRHGASPSARHR